MIKYFSAILILLISCRQTDERKLFSLINSKDSGIDFINKIEDTENFNIIEYLYFYNGGGVALGDINNDGLVDIFFTANQTPNRLYLNKGNFKFEDITTKSGIGGIGDWSTGVTMTDINGDGLLDIYVCNVSGYKGLDGRNELFINNGDLTFAEKASEFGLDFSGFSTQSAFFDYDRDGDLDMYLLNHAVHTTHSYGSAEKRLGTDLKSGDRLFESNMTDGEIEFTDVTQNSGIYSSHIGYGLGVGITDINQDGWPDIYVSNDFHENDYLYINDGQGSFSDNLPNMMGHTSRYSMGNDIGDINNDGLMDIMTLDMLPNDPEILKKSAGEDNQEVYDIKVGYGYSHQYSRNALQVNLGDNFLADIALQSNTYDTDWSWAPLICDLDNDTFNDIFIANGIFKRPNDLDYINFISSQNQYNTSKSNQKIDFHEMLKKMPSLKISNFVYKNSDGQHFMDSTDSWGLSEPSYSNGAGYADLDNDGDLDLVINNVNQEAFLYENKTNTLKAHNYLQVQLIGSGYNKYGLGTKVTVYANDITLVKEMQPTRGFQSSVEPMLTFGLGTISEVDSLRVIWPNGLFEVIQRLKVNQKVKIDQANSSQPYSYKKIESATELSIHDKIGLKFTHQEDKNFQDYNIEPLIPYNLSTEGPALTIADVNNDNLDDVYIGGAKGQKSALYIQNSAGKFDLSNQTDLYRDLFYEDIDAAFFDADNDGDKDVYVVSGGNEYTAGHALLADRLYLNDGNGIFSRQDIRDNSIVTNGSCVRPCDFDQDGDIDLFVGSRSFPGAYGWSPDSYLLTNDGKGNFSHNTEMSDQLKKLGMVTDAIWTDYDSDDDPDLVIIGDWMPITVFENNEGKFTKADIGFNKSNGWWKTISAGDIDNDGDEDFVVGNFGNNNKLKASPEQPVSLYLKDFDNNGQTDPVIFHYKKGKNIPFASRDELGKQMPFIKKRFNTYEAFAAIDGINSMFNARELEDMVWKSVHTFESTVFINNGSNMYTAEPLPNHAQMSTINKILIQDIDNDNYMDLLTVGNFYGAMVSLGRFDAMPGARLRGRGNGKFDFISPLLTSPNNWGEYRGLESINIDGIRYFITVRNNDILNAFKEESFIKQLNPDENEK